jgi:hypothetical protein
MFGHSLGEEADLKIAVPHGYRICVVRIIGLALEGQLVVDLEAGNQVLTALERDARDLGVERVRVADGRIPVALEIRCSLRIRPLHKLVDALLTPPFDTLRVTGSFDKLRVTRPFDTLRVTGFVILSLGFVILSLSKDELGELG